MKHLTPYILAAIFGLTLSFNAQAQSPEKFNYQAVLRDNGQLVTNGAVDVRFTIRNNTATGTALYQEVHNTTTDYYGLINIAIGSGTVVSGTFSSINWGGGAKYLQVEIDYGPGGFDDMGAQQLLSVPYALHSKTADSIAGGVQNQPIAGNGISIFGDTISSVLGTDISTSELQNGAVTSAKLNQMSATSGEVLKWNGTAWIPASDSSSFAGWTLSGNAGTDSTNFIGTTDTIALRFKVNNIEAGIISSGTPYNVAIGQSALSSVTTGKRNTGIGYNALQDNTTGDINTASGFYALLNNISGDYNTAHGGFALYSNTTGALNTGIGGRALYFNTQGTFNTANGYVSMYNNITGQYNTASGYRTLYYNTTGDYNTALGFSAIDDLSGTTNQNTAIGSLTDIIDNADNSSVIGYGAYANTSNKIVIGNNSITSIGGYASWSNLSDARFKTDMQPIQHGLDFIMKLKPITYHYNMQKLHNFMEKREGEAEEKDPEWLDEAMAAKAAILYTGFSAQQVEAAAKKIGYNFSGVHAPENEFGHYTLSYAEFVVPLVKAVQEQQRMIEKQQAQINAQSTTIKALQAQNATINILKTKLQAQQKRLEIIEKILAQ